MKKHFRLEPFTCPNCKHALHVRRFQYIDDGSDTIRIAIDNDNIEDGVDHPWIAERIAERQECITLDNLVDDALKETNSWLQSP